MARLLAALLALLRGAPVTRCVCGTTYSGVSRCPNVACPSRSGAAQRHPHHDLPCALGAGGGACGACAELANRPDGGPATPGNYVPPAALLRGPLRVVPPVAAHADTA